MSSGIGSPSGREPEIVLSGGRVVDGSGREAQRADICIRGEAITSVGDIGRVRNDYDVDLLGLHTLPGFVDAHSHAAGFLDDPDVQAACLHQSVATLVVGAKTDWDKAAGITLSFF